MSRRGYYLSRLKMSAIDDVCKMKLLIRAACEQDEAEFLQILRNVDPALISDCDLAKDVELKETCTSCLTWYVTSGLGDLEKAGDLDCVDIKTAPCLKLLHLVAVVGTPNMMEAMMPLGRDFDPYHCPEPFPPDPKLMMPLFCAIAYKNWDMAEHLLGFFCSVDNFVQRHFLNDTKNSMLVSLVKMGTKYRPALDIIFHNHRLSAVRGIVQSQLSALSWTINHHDVECLNIILAAGVNPDCCECDKDSVPVVCTAVKRACTNGGRVDSPAFNTLEALLVGGAKLNPAVPLIQSPLYSAVLTDSVAVVELLLRFGADPDGTSGNAGAPIMSAACRNSFGIVDLLTRYGADVNAGDGVGYAALHQAADFGFLETVTVLLGRKDIDVDLKTTNHQASALNIAAASNNLNVLRALLKHGCDVNTRDVLKNTPLHYMVANGCTEGVELLLAAGCHVDAKNSANASPLWNAVEQQRSEICKLLLRHDVDISVESTGVVRGHGSRKMFVFTIFLRPCSLLWVAVERASLTIVNILLESGLDIYREGWILTHYAATGNTDLALQDYLTSLISKPPALQQICKNVLLKRYGRNLSRLPKTVSLPTAIHKFLMQT